MQINAHAQHVHPGCNCAVAGIASDPMLYVDRYQEAVRMHPGCPAEVRLGLAACYFRLGQLERAKRAYERVVQLSPSCAEALYGLAVLRFSSSQGESAKAVSRLMQTLRHFPALQLSMVVMLQVLCSKVRIGVSYTAHTLHLH